MRSTHVALLFAIVASGAGVRCEAAPIRTGDAPPKVKTFPRQTYVAVRSQVPMQELGKAIPSGIGKVIGWLASHGKHPSGPPFIRYLVVDMPKRLDIEVGFPVAGPVKASGPVVAGAFPAGRYVTCTHVGRPESLVGANAALVAWAHKNGIHLDRKSSALGFAWGCRVERYLTDPSRERDPNKYKTEILYEIAK